MESAIMSMDCTEFCVFLEDKGYHEDVIRNFSANRVSGATFVHLTDDDLKELLPVIGDRVGVRKLLEEVKMVCTYEGIEADNLLCITNYGCFLL